MNTEPGVARKSVLVTGGARRIGAAICQRFHDAGYDVMVHCNRSMPAAALAVDRFNRLRKDSAVLLQADLTQAGQVDRLAAACLQAFGRIDVLVNNASSYYRTPLGTLTQDQWDDLLGSNLRGAFFLTQALAPGLRESRGAIVNVIDIYGDRPPLHYPVYAIAKAGLQAMTRSLARELAPRVRVNGVAPGAILLPEGDAEPDAQAPASLLETIPLGRMGEPGDIAEAVYFLATTATYMTGDVIRVDGGRALNL